MRSEVLWVLLALGWTYCAMVCLVSLHARRAPAGKRQRPRSGYLSAAPGQRPDDR